MRAIPSPHDSTRPVSRTSTWVSKPLISCLRISLISAGLISAIINRPEPALPAHLALHAIKPRRQAGIISPALKFRHHPANQTGIDIDGRDYLLAREPLQAFDHRF